MSIYPYASPLEYTIPFYRNMMTLSLALFLFFSSPLDLDSDYNVQVDPTEDKMSKTYQIKTDIPNV